MIEALEPSPRNGEESSNFCLEEPQCPICLVSLKCNDAEYASFQFSRGLCGEYTVLT